MKQFRFNSVILTEINLHCQRELEAFRIEHESNSLWTIYTVSPIYFCVCTIFNWNVNNKWFHIKIERFYELLLIDHSTLCYGKCELRHHLQTADMNNKIDSFRRKIQDFYKLKMFVYVILNSWQMKKRTSTRFMAPTKFWF